MAVKEKLNISGARIVWPNFSGKATDYNAEGKRNFTVVFEDEGKFNTMKVNIGAYKGDPARDPKIYRICNGHKVLLTEKTVGCLDFDDITYIDLRVRPYNWERANKSGTSAYLDVMYVTVADDPFAAKYETVEDNFTDPEEAPF